MQHFLFLYAGPKSLPDLFGGLGFPGTPAVMGADLQRHIHRAVSGEILDFLDIQTSLEQTRDSRFGHRLVGLHSDHILRMGSLLPFSQPRLQFFRKRDISLSGFRLEVFRNRSRALFNRRIVPDVDDLLLEVDILPLEVQDLSPTHSCMEADQQERLRTGVLYPIQKGLTFFCRQGFFFLRGFFGGFQYRVY